MKKHMIVDPSSTSPNTDPSLTPESETSFQFSNWYSIFPKDKSNSYLSKVMLALMIAPIKATQESLPAAAPSSYKHYNPNLNNASTPINYDESIIIEIKKIFNQGSHEVFFDGEFSQFSAALSNLINKHGIHSFKALSDFLLTETNNSNVVAEALNWISEFNSAGTRSDQWNVLKNMLNSSDGRIRDAAILGFSVIDDPNALPFLSAAFEREPISELKNLLKQVINQLRANINDTSSSIH